MSLSVDRGGSEEVLFHALDLLAQVDPIWLNAQIPSEWVERYRQRPTTFRFPKSDKEKLELALQIGGDGRNLLSKIGNASSAEYLRKLPAIETLRRIWIQNYYQEEGMISWREEKDCPPASLRVISPYDLEVRNSTHGDVFWRGYKVHFTETCDEETPHLITDVETTPDTEQETTTLYRIHSALERKQLLPTQHFVDAGYSSAELLSTSQSRYGIDLYGPVRPDITWQTQAEQAIKIS
jgi:transposase